MQRFLLPCLLVASCGLPRDVEGTSERVMASHVLRVGTNATGDPLAGRFLDRLARTTGAKIVSEEAPLEQLIDRLDHGRIDLIVAPVRADALLVTEVALGPPLDGSDPGDHPVSLRAAVRNGENRWIMTVEAAAREAAGQ